MDPFTEKDIIDSLRSMAVSLRNIDRKLDDIALSLREMADSEGDSDGESDEISGEDPESSRKKSVN